MTRVFNLRTQQWTLYFCPPAQAVVSAYEHYKINTEVLSLFKKLDKGTK